MKHSSLITLSHFTSLCVKEIPSMCSVSVELCEKVLEVRKGLKWNFKREIFRGFKFATKMSESSYIFKVSFSIKRMKTFGYNYFAKIFHKSSKSWKVSRRFFFFSSTLIGRLKGRKIKRRRMCKLWQNSHAPSSKWIFSLTNGIERERKLGKTSSCLLLSNELNFINDRRSKRQTREKWIKFYEKCFIYTPTTAWELCFSVASKEWKNVEQNDILLKRVEGIKVQA